MNAPIDTLGLVPRKDTLTGLVSSWYRDGKITRCDDSVAPIMVEKLRYTYAQVYEIKYRNLKAANGEVLGFDTSPDPADDSYRYEVLDYAGYADWIGDDGTVMGEGSMQLTPHLGFMHEIGHKFSFTVFDLERAAKDGRQLPSVRQRVAKRAHDEKHNWTWLFGDPDKQLHGLFTHPNIQIVQAPVASSAVHSDNRDRLIENKTVDEILADVASMVDLVPETTNEELMVRKIMMPRVDVSVLKHRRVGAGDGTLTIWQLIQSMYPDVEFMVLPECDATKRINPKTGVNDSSVAGRCWIAVPDAPVDECGFVLTRPFTQRAPQEQDLKISTITHSKIGGFKCVVPLGVVRLDFIAIDDDTAAP